MELKDRIKQLRNEYGYSGEELGRLIGVSKAAIGNYESGYRKPRPEQLEALADVFNVDMDYLMCRTNTKLRVSLEENRMHYLLNKLNDAGKREAVKRVDELTCIPKYQIANNTSSPELLAAHARTTIKSTEDGLKQDLDIMNNDDMWK